MRLGVVTGCVWATKKCAGLRGQILLRVQTGGQELVAADLVGAGVGDRVLLCYGAAARLEQPQAPVDVAIVGILDEMEEHNVCQ